MAVKLAQRNDRLSAIEAMLFRTPDGLRAVAIAAACGVDRRTVYRDLALLNEIGVPIVQHDGRFWLDHERYQASLRLSAGESTALLLAASAIARGTSPLHAPLASAVEKLSRALPEPIARYAGHLVSDDSAPLEPTLQSALETLLQAWGDGQAARVWYCSRDREKVRQRVVEVYFIGLRTRGALIIGYDQSRHRISTLDLRRVVRVKCLIDTYRIPSTFDLAGYLNERRAASHKSK